MDPEAAGCAFVVEFKVGYGSELDEVQAPSEESTEELGLESVDEAPETAGANSEVELVVLADSYVSVEVGKIIVGNVLRSE
jgi:hypothetical protein